MRIGVVSDTHNQLRNVTRIVELFDAARVDRVEEPPLSLAWQERLLILHDPHFLSNAMLAEHDVVLHGHTHRAVHERRNGALVFNPGECAGMLAGHNAVGLLTFESLEVEWLRF